MGSAVFAEDNEDEEQVEQGDNETTGTPGEEEELEYYDFIIIGAGVGAASAYEALIARSPDAKILFVNSESVLPYDHRRMASLL